MLLSACSKTLGDSSLHIYAHDVSDFLITGFYLTFVAYIQKKKCRQMGCGEKKIILKRRKSGKCIKLGSKVNFQSKTTITHQNDHYLFSIM